MKYTFYDAFRALDLAFNALGVPGHNFPRIHIAFKSSTDEILFKNAIDGEFGQSSKRPNVASRLCGMNVTTSVIWKYEAVFKEPPKAPFWKLKGGYAPAYPDGFKGFKPGTVYPGAYDIFLGN